MFGVVVVNQKNYVPTTTQDFFCLLSINTLLKMDEYK